MAELDELATKTLTEAKLPGIFSYRQAFILGYNKRKTLEYTLLYGGSTLDRLENRDGIARGYLRMEKENKMNQETLERLAATRDRTMLLLYNIVYGRKEEESHDDQNTSSETPPSDTRA